MRTFYQWLIYDRSDRRCIITRFVLDDLYINGGKRFKNKNEKTYVIFDSGTTGLLISNSLYENSAFRDGAFQAAMTFTDVKGNKS